MRYVIDRIEDDRHVVLEPASGKGAGLTVFRDWLPESASEGDVLTVTHEVGDSRARVEFEIDSQARAERERHLKSLRDDLPEAPKGDLRL